MRPYIRIIVCPIFLLVLGVPFKSWAQAPTIYIASPSNGATFDILPGQTTVNITFQIRSDISPRPDRVDFQLDNGPWHALMCAGIYCKPPIDHTLSIGGGQHTYYVAAMRYVGGDVGYVDIGYASVTFTCIQYYNVTVKNNFSGGSIIIDGSTYSNVPEEGITNILSRNSAHTLTAINNQNVGGYVRVFDQWTSTVPGENPTFDLERNITVSATGTYTANFNRQFNITVSEAQFVEPGSGGTYNITRTNPPLNLSNVFSWSGTSVENRSSPITLEAVPPSGWVLWQWSDGNTSNPRTLTPTDHVNGLSARLKAHLASSSPTATSPNNQRKLVKWGGYYHLVYQSGGHIWYVRSADAGASWSPEEMVSAASEENQNTNPAIDADGLGNVFVVYEAPFGSYRAIAIKQKLSGTWTLLRSEGFLASSELKPVIAVSKETTSPKVVVVVQANGYTNSDPGLYHVQLGYAVGKVSETSASSLNPSLAYTNLVYQENNVIYRKSITFTNPIVIGNREAVSTSGFNGRPLSNISNPSIAVREGVDYEWSRRPVIAWQAQDVVFSSYRPIFVRHPVSTSNGQPNFVLTVFDWASSYQKGRTPTVNVYQTPPNLGYENPDVSAVWQEEANDAWNGPYQNVVAVSKINGTWNSQITLSTVAKYSNVAQGDVAQSSSGGALVTWAAASGPPYVISAFQKTNSGGGPVASSIVIGAMNMQITQMKYMREMQVDLNQLGVEGLGGILCLELEETSDAGFLPIEKLGSLSESFLKLQSLSQVTATITPRLWLVDLRLPKSLTAAQRGQEIYSLVSCAGSTVIQKKSVSLANLLAIWKNRSSVGTSEIASDSTEVLLFPGGTVQLQVDTGWISQAKGTTYLEILCPAEGSVQEPKKQGSLIEVRPLPTEFALDQNYPNPFNPSTMIRYQLPQDAHVTLKLYDLLGQAVATLVDESKPAGYHEATLDASRLASGVYFFKMAAGEYTSVKKLVVMK